MRLEQLEYLIEVARTGSINQASEKLLMAQQNLSRSLRQLEEELQVTLLNRSYQGAQLTTAGQQAVAIAEEILTQVQLLKQLRTAQPNTSPVSGQITIYCVLGTVSILISDRLNKFQERYPEIQLLIKDLEAGELYQQLVNHPEAVGLSSLFLKHSQPEGMLRYQSQIQLYPMANDRLAIMVSKDHPLAQQKSITLRSLLRHPISLMLAGDLENSYTYTLFCEYGQPNIAYTTRNLSLYLQNIRASNTVGPVTYSAFYRNGFDKHGVALLLLRPQLDILIQIATSRNFIHTPAADLLLDFLKSDLLT